jgi:serine/threonine protein kinase
MFVFSQRFCESVPLGRVSHNHSRTSAGQETVYPSLPPTFHLPIIFLSLSLSFASAFLSLKIVTRYFFLSQLQAEIKIHRTLKHKNVCEYKHFFEDRQNCYILLELCHNQSMNEMIKRRKRITEPETAFLMKQLLEAVKYMHAQLVIHRDLKLGNLFLDRNTNIKVGDLGLATRLESADEKRKTICGTPNYIAPEVIQGDRATRGHSFEVDVWSMGVIMFTCLCGKPPYEAKDVKATYQRILANEYSFPRDVSISDDAKDLICCMLQSKPLDRPSLDEIASHPFFTARPIPESLPSNATHFAPQLESDAYGSIATTTCSRRCGGGNNSSGLGKPALPKAGTSTRRPFGSRDVNVENRNGGVFGRANSKQNLQVNGSSAPSSVTGSVTSAHSNPIADVQGVVRNAWSAVVNAATSTTPSSSAGFKVFDETASDRRSKQSDDIVTRTSNMGIRTTPMASPFSNGTSNSQFSSREPIATPSRNGIVENDVAILNNMIDRITTVLDIVSSRSYGNVPPDSRSLASCNRGGPAQWVSRYVDYTSKYGLGYLLNDGR